MNRHIIRLKHPASWHTDSWNNPSHGNVAPDNGAWRDALRLGNGLTGALIHGAIAEETIQFTRYELWHHGNPGPQIPDVSDAFRQMRALIDAGDYAAANTNLFAKALTEKGYYAEPHVPYPLGSLKCLYAPASMFRNYERGIDMRSGESFVRFKIGTVQFMRKAFVSRADDITVIKITADAPFTTSYYFEMHEKEGAFHELYSHAIHSCSADKSTGVNIYFTGDISTTIADKRLFVTGREYMIFVQAYAGKAPSDFAALRRLSYEELLARHTALHTTLYDSVDIELAADDAHNASCEQLLAEAYDDAASPVLLEKLWRYGRYLFISSASENGIPVPLYGLWPGADDLPWTQYVANENVEMTYWHVLAGGLSYSIKPLIRYYLEKLDVFKESAQKMFGMNGAWLSAYTSPGVSGPCVPVGVISNWISCGGWLSQHFWNYYCYTGDQDTLRSDIMPFMYEVARFYLDYVTYDENGTMQLYPSVSPENTPGNLMPAFYSENMGHQCPAVKNATMDFAVMKEFLTNFLSGIEQTGLYTEEADIYRNLLAQIPPYMINEDGAVKEWMAPDLKDHYYHRHLSHIYPVFPGKEINAANDPELFAAFKQAVNLRELGGQSGWSLAHMSNIYARMGEPELAIECLDTLAKSAVNNALITMHNDWRHMGMTLDLQDFAPVQMDANFGAVSAIQEMLFYCSGDKLFLLPALPERLSCGKVRDIVFPRGRVDLEWDGDRIFATITAASDFTADVYIKKTLIETVSLKAGEHCTLRC